MSPRRSRALSGASSPPVRPMTVITTKATITPSRTRRNAERFYSSISTCRASAATADSTSAMHGLRAQCRREVEFHNTGSLQCPGLLSYPAPNVGIFEFTKAPGDVGKFKAPTLRNIALTAPYMHDGSIADARRRARSLCRGRQNHCLRITCRDRPRQSQQRSADRRL